MLATWGQNRAESAPASGRRESRIGALITHSGHHGNLKPVIGQAHARGQGAVGFFVAQLVGNVGKPGLARANAARPAQRLLHGGVAGMRFVAQRGKNELIEASSSAKLDSGIPLTSVRYAALPKRKPAIS